MDNSSAIIAIAAALAIALSTIFPAIAQGKTAAAAMESIARQPDAAKDIRSALIISMANHQSDPETVIAFMQYFTLISMALMEALTIYGLLIAFMLISKI